MPKKNTTHPGGKYLRELRDARGMTQTELGRAIGYNEDNEIRGFELGTRKIGVEDLIKIEQVLGLSRKERRQLHALFGLEDLKDFEGLAQEHPDIRQFIDQYRAAADSENNMAHFWAVKTFHQAIDSYRRIAASNGFEFFPHEHDEVMEHLYGLPCAGDEIQAVSWDEIDEWEEALRGGRCVEFNALAAQRGVNVERIFIYRNTEELNQLSRICHAQHRRGIHIRTAHTAKLDNVDYQNRLIIHTAQYGTFTAYPEHSDGKLHKAYISWDQRITEEFERIYQIIRSVSTEWKEPRA